MRFQRLFCAIVLCTAVCMVVVDAHNGGRAAQRIRAFEHVRQLLANSKTASHEAQAGVAFEASPPFIHNMANLTIKWSGVSSPQGADIIALFALEGASTDFNLESVFAFQYCNATTTCETGAGTLVFPYIPNIRQNFCFAYFKAGIIYERLVISNRIETNASAPLQGHLVLTSDPSEMRIMWVSNNSNPTPTVEYGTSPNDLSLTTKGISYTYSIEQLCGAPANLPVNFIDPGFIHDAVMTNLTPATTYYYRFGNDEGGWSPIRHFRSAPTIDANQPVKFIAYGDLGVSDCGFMNGWCESAAATTFTRVKREAHNHDLVLHIGDISYAVGYSVRWEQFFHQLEPIASHVPYMVAMGNHEFDFNGTKFNSYFNGTDSGGECGIPFLARFHMPGFVPFSKSLNYGSHPNQTDLTAPFYYSFDYGSVHFVIVSTEQDPSDQGAQYQWLVEDLASVDRRRTPWVILAGHRSMYVSSNTTGAGRTGDQQVSQVLREYLEPVIVKYGVDMCLWGHTHLYERTCPMVHNGTCAEGKFDKPKLHPPYGAPVHVVVGMAGFSLSHNLAYPVPNWSMFRVDQAHGYATITVHNATALQFRFIGDTTGSVHDEFWILKD